MPQRVSKDNFQSEVLSADTLVLADFYSDSCIPCKRLSPVLFELEKEYEGKKKDQTIHGYWSQGSYGAKAMLYADVIDDLRELIEED